MINVSEIVNIESNRKNNKKELYKKIYEQFSRKIRCTVELGGKFVMLRVPSVVFGYPTFDRSHACAYLRRQLELSGFNVDTLSAIDLCVTWSSPRKNKPVETPRDETDIPSFINLKKMANKYRNGA
tara:strand:- start:1490 stop:1867 length:378 start_codon:yes stop_codon:yes gene_type:complete